MSHDPTTTGFDALNPLSREGESTVKWPILAQLPWVGEPQAGAEPVPRSTALPYESTADDYSLPPMGGPPTKSPALRLVEPQSDYGDEEFSVVEPLDRRLHATPVEGRSATEPPHLNLHRFTPAEPLRAVVEEPEYRAPRTAASAAPRQYRRVDPPQIRTTPSVSLHAPAESLAARFYQWHASARPQLGLIAFAGLILLGGGLYWAAFGKARTQPATSTVEAWSVEAPPQPSMGGSAIAPAPASNALPTPPTLDLAPKPTSGDPRAGAAATSEPATAVELSTSDDPIAAWLNSQPLATPRVEAQKVVAEPAVVKPTVVEPAAVEPAVVAPIANTSPPQLVLPTSSPSMAPAPIVRDETITPTPAGLSLSLGYPTTPYPPFNFSLCQPPTQTNVPSVAETWGLPIQQPSTPR